MRVYLSTQGKRLSRFSYLPPSAAYVQKPSLSRFLCGFVSMPLLVK
ncbi:MAG: hypothetical protein FWH25_01835 [Syntrophorhabdaceae bacterium]|nr:hypothetical protein [Syntrophorhabdaceae bacterium]